MEKKNELRFRFYGDFEQINYIYGDCQKDLIFQGSSTRDGSPIFVYHHNLDTNLVDDTEKLNLYLRDLKLRHMLNKDLTEDELSMFTFFRFYIKSKDELLIKKINNMFFKY